MQGRDGRNQQYAALAIKGPFAGDHFVQQRAKRKDVGARVGFESLELFRRHVLESAKDRSRCRDVFARRQCCGSLCVRPARGSPRSPFRQTEIQ